MFKKKLFALMLIGGLLNPVVSNASSENYKDVYDKKYESLEEFKQGRNKLPEGAVLSGQFGEDALVLDFDNDWFLHAPIVDPCDTFDSNITIKNNSDKDMEVRLIDIINQLEDNLMYKAFTVEIKKDGEVLYKGGLGDNKGDIIEWITIKPGELIVLNINTQFSCEAGNEYQNKEMVTSWLFEGRIEEKEKPKEDKPDIPDKPDKPKEEKITTEKPKEEITQTSDMSNVNQYLNIMSVVLLMLIAGLLAFNVKKERKDKVIK